MPTRIKSTLKSLAQAGIDGLFIWTVMLGIASGLWHGQPNRAHLLVGLIAFLLAPRKILILWGILLFVAARSVFGFFVYGDSRFLLLAFGALTGFALVAWIAIWWHHKKGKELYPDFVKANTQSNLSTLKLRDTRLEWWLR